MFSWLWQFYPEGMISAFSKKKFKILKCSETVEHVEKQSCKKCNKKSTEKKL